MELKIGERLTLECQESKTGYCEDCYFKEQGGCVKIKCARYHRADDKSVKFVQVECDTYNREEKENLMRRVSKEVHNDSIATAKEIALEWCCDTCQNRCDSKSLACDKYKDLCMRLDYLLVP